MSPEEYEAFLRIYKSLREVLLHHMDNDKHPWSMFYEQLQRAQLYICPADLEVRGRDLTG